MSDCPLRKRFSFASRGNWSSTDRLHYDLHHHNRFDADLLLMVGAKPTTEMLKCAVEAKKTKWVKLFIQEGAKPTDDMLDIAARNKDLKTAKALVGAGAKPSDRLTSRAVYDLTWGWIELLVAAKGTPPVDMLWSAIVDRQSETARYLLVKGAVPDEKIMQLARDKGYPQDKKMMVVWDLLVWAFNDHQQKLAAKAAKEVVLKKSSVPQRKLMIG